MDFLGHLVDAPFANILIVAGLLFLGIGAVGKVVGKIEPDKFGRVMASLLGIVLLAGGVVVHIKSDSSSRNPPTSSVQPVGPVVEFQPPTATRRGESGVPRAATKPSAKKKDQNVQPKGDDGTGTAENADSQYEQPAFYASQEPPQLKDETRMSYPGGNSIWTPGSWYYDHNQSDYYWVSGLWVIPPNGEVWTPPYWEYDDDSKLYAWHAGYWGPHIGFYGGIDYGFGYVGRGYDPLRKNTRSLNRISCNGGPRRLKKVPIPKEFVAKRERLPPLDNQVRGARSASKDPKRFAGYNQPPMENVSLKKPTVGRDDSVGRNKTAEVASHPTHPGAERCGDLTHPKKGTGGCSDPSHPDPNRQKNGKTSPGDRPPTNRSPTQPKPH
jgi:WXXGXW repeat (2 copies)